MAKKKAVTRKTNKPVTRKEFHHHIVQLQEALTHHDRVLQRFIKLEAGTAVYAKPITAEELFDILAHARVYPVRARRRGVVDEFDTAAEAINKRMGVR